MTDKKKEEVTSKGRTIKDLPQWAKDNEVILVAAAKWKEILDMCFEPGAQQRQRQIAKIAFDRLGGKVTRVAKR